jgi:hypothetical protein
MMMNKCRLIVVLTAAVAGAGTGIVQGVEPLRPETVTTRERPELDPLGMRAGAFLIYPAMTIDGVHDDNIFAVESDEDSDFITHFRPELAIESDWGRHALNFDAGADIGRYNDNGDEDYEDYRVSLDGRLDMQRQNNLSARAGYANEHVPRSSPNDENGTKPTTYDIGSLSAAYRHRLNRLTFRVGGAFKQFDYDNVKASDGTTINNQDQNRDVDTYLAQVNYELQPEYSAFLRTRYKDVKYDQKYDDNGLQRSSDGYQVDVGTELFLSGVMFGEVYLGYVDRNYDDPTLNDIDTVTGGAALTWLPTGLTTVTFTVDRDIAETIVDNASGILETEAGVRVDHELLRNLLLNARLAAMDEDFEGTSRNDNYLTVGLGAEYLMNRYLYLTMGYAYQDRDSNEAGEDFTDNRFLVGIRGQL